jgi:adhesin/invasin
MKKFAHAKIKFLLFLGFCLAFAFIKNSSFQSGGAAAQSDFNVNLPVVLNDYQSYLGGIGDISGEVQDAQDNSPLIGALICSSVPCNSADPATFTFTNSNGYYELSGIASGEHNMSATIAGYLTIQQKVIIKPDTETTQNFALSKVIEEAGVMRIVLTWNETPADLDAMLWTPITEYPKIWYVDRGNCSDIPYACLDTDDKNGYGPETITVSQLQPGNYAFGVHNPNYTIFPNITPLTQSGAQVRVYNSTGVINEFSVPVVGQGDLWYVFDLNGDTGEITPVNCITDYGAGGAPQCNP